ncbi:MAG: OmpA family protein [Verrucomicrobiota bacterium]
MIAGVTLLHGQKTVVTCFGEDAANPMIGIVPTADYEALLKEREQLRKRVMLVEREQRKLQVALSVEKKKGDGGQIQQLQAKLQAARKETRVLLEKERKAGGALRQEMVAKVAEMEKLQEGMLAQFEERMGLAQMDFGKKQEEWEGRLLESQNETAGVWDKLEESELQRIRENEAWMKAVTDWRKKAGEALQSAKVRITQDAVANTARLAGEWREERASLQAEVERLNKEVKTLEGELNAKGFGNQQTEMLRQGLAEKKKELRELGEKAGGLVEAWKKERAHHKAKLARLEQENEKVTAVLKARQAKFKEVQESLEKKSKSLTEFATKAEDASKKWAREREDYEKQIGGLRVKLKEVQEELNQVEGQEKAAAELGAQLEREHQALLTHHVEHSEEVERERREQLIATQKMTKEFALAQKEKEELTGVVEKLSAELAANEGSLQEFQKKSVEEAERAEALALEMGRLVMAQEALEGTLRSSLADFEKLQVSYVELQEKAKEGSEEKAAQEQLVRAQDELKRLRGELKKKDATLVKARQEVQKAEERWRMAQEEISAGKEALGKSESALVSARQHLKTIEAGRSDLATEAEKLRREVLAIEPVRYRLGSADVALQRERVLAEVREVLAVYPGAKLKIQGHTCNQGSVEGNQRLSEARAEELRDFLEANGVGEESFGEVSGVGDTVPEASNETEEGREQNRRVVIEVVR